jgi:hypothetical protein
MGSVLARGLLLGGLAYSEGGGGPWKELEGVVGVVIYYVLLLLIQVLIILLLLV